MKFAHYLFGTIQALTLTKTYATQCWPEVEVEFEGNKAKVESSKELSNVVVYDGCTTVKYDNLSGYYGNYYSENLNNDACVVWVKSGCNSSGDGPGYGEKFEKPGDCEPVDCGTKKPTTLKPTTAKPVSKSPTTKSPTTKCPTKESPTTKSPVTLKPTTNSPVTAKPTTNSPVTVKPTTESPVTDKPTTESPVTDKPTTNSPVTAKPTTNSPVTEKPTTNSPVTEKPTTNSPVTEKPTTESPVTDKPTTNSPVTAKPTTNSPVTVKPTTNSPVTEKPTTNSPVTEKPTTEAPVTDKPTTAKPTTAAPITNKPTTSEPTTARPTTLSPTTKKPTTMRPTYRPTKKPTQELYANLVVVLDRSGSISDLAFKRAKNYIINNIDCNKPRYVCVVAFGQKPQMVVPCTTNMVMVKKVLNNLVSLSDGTKALTNIAAAMRFVVEPKRMPAESQKNTLLLFMSDAKANLPGFGDNNILAVQAAKASAPAVKKKTWKRLCLGLDNPNTEMLHAFCDKESTTHITNPNKPGLCPRL